MILVCGPKGSGKSTFCRSLINASLTRPRIDLQSASTSSGILPQSALHFFDIDPGQPEYALPGQIALLELRNCILGPPFTHPEVDTSSDNRFLQLQCYGSLSPKENLVHYLDCVAKLYDTYSASPKSHADLATVINCSGWVQAGGLDLLVQLVQRLHVTDIVYISDGSGLEEVTDTFADVCSAKSTRLHVLPSSPSRSISRSATELRMMQALSYFHLAEPEAGELRWNRKTLQEMAPVVVHYSGPKQGIFAIMVLGDEQSPDLIETILEGCLVDLVVVENDWALPESENVSDETESQVPDDRGETPEYLYHPSIRRSPTSMPYLPAKNHVVHPLPPKYTHSIGQAIVRSIDTKHHQINLIMPVHFVLPRIHQRPEQKIVLVRGKLDIPVWAYKEPFERDKARRRRREQHSGMKEEGGDVEDLRSLVEQIPWASVVEGKRNVGAKKRSGRRDLRYRSQAVAE